MGSYTSKGIYKPTENEVDYALSGQLAYDLIDDYLVSGEIGTPLNTFRIKKDGPDGDQYIQFFEDGAGPPVIHWDHSNNRFEINRDLLLSTGKLLFVDNSHYLNYDIDHSKFYLGGDLYISGELTADDVHGLVLSGDSAIITAPQIKSAEFYGESSVGSINFGNVLNFDSSFTIEVWCKLDAKSAGYYWGAFSKNNASAVFDLKAMSDNHWGFHITTTTGEKGVDSLGFYKTHTWQHIAVVWDKDADQLVMYVDGVKQNDIFVATGNRVVNAANFEVGRNNYGGGTKDYDGLIDEFRIWNKVRTLAEIVEDSEKTLTGNEDGLIFYQTFDPAEWYGGTIYDKSPSGYNSISITGVTPSSAVPFADRGLKFKKSDNTYSTVRWDALRDHLEFRDDVYVKGVLSGEIIESDNDILAHSGVYINSNGPEGTSYLYFYNSGSPTGAYLRFREDGLNRFELSHNFYANAMGVTGNMISDHGDMFIRGAGGAYWDYGYLYFLEGAKQASIKFEHTPDHRFEFDHNLMSTGEISGQYIYSSKYINLGIGGAIIPDLGIQGAAIEKARSSSSTKPHWLQACFDDTIQEFIQWNLIFPDDYYSNLEAIVKFKALANAGNVQFSIGLAAVSNNEFLNGKSFAAVNSAYTSVPAVSGTLKDLAIPLTNIDSLAGGDYLTVELSRDPAGTDTLAGDAEVVGLRLKYRARS